jgi:hypothetical protein
MKNTMLTAMAFFGWMMAHAQTGYYQVAGKILDGNTQLPLAAASVFAQNTTHGTATGADGSFTLWLPNGGYDLVVTFTGYETISKRISTADEDNKSIVLQIRPKEKSLEEVAIKSSNEVKNGWEKYGLFFMEQFLGKTPNSKDCIIKNPDLLRFYFSKKRNRLKVMSDAPIQVENLRLGYSVQFALDSFVHDYNAVASAYSGYPLFTALVPADTAQQLQWQANRRKAYQGSMLHFMRSLYHRQLVEEGFEVQFIVQVNGADSALKGLKVYEALNYEKNDSLQVVDISPNQQELAILYKNEKPDAAYLAENTDAPATFQLSVINIPGNVSIGIEQNGFHFNQSDITLTGYWGWQKLADMLPYDFK